MAMRHGSASLPFGRQSMGTALLMVLLLVVLAAAIMLAANTPWVLDQPVSPYDWAIAR